MSYYSLRRIQRYTERSHFEVKSREIPSFAAPVCFFQVARPAEMPSSPAHIYLTLSTPHDRPCDSSCFHTVFAYFASPQSRPQQQLDLHFASYLLVHEQRAHHHPQHPTEHPLPQQIPLTRIHHEKPQANTFAVEYDRTAKLQLLQNRSHRRRCA